jgi:hypothetical protein
MPKATGFYLDPETGDIKMNRGDTGSFWVKETRKSGDEWTEYDRMLFTIKDAQGNIVMQRFYRLDDQWDQGNGIALIEFHNDDTDTWEPGQYSVELRFDVSPVWEGTPPEGRCENALATDARIVEGSIVRTAIHSTLQIDNVLGKI